MIYIDYPFQHFVHFFSLKVYVLNTIFLPILDDCKGTDLVVGHHRDLSGAPSPVRVGIVLPLGLNTIEHVTNSLSFSL